MPRDLIGAGTTSVRAFPSVQEQAALSATGRRLTRLNLPRFGQTDRPDWSISAMPLSFMLAGGPTSPLAYVTLGVNFLGGLFTGLFGGPRRQPPSVEEQMRKAHIERLQAAARKLTPELIPPAAPQDVINQAPDYLMQMMSIGGH